MNTKYTSFTEFREALEAEHFEIHQIDRAIYVKYDTNIGQTDNDYPDMRDIGMIPLDETGSLHIFDAYWLIGTQANKVFSKYCTRFSATPFEFKGI